MRPIHGVPQQPTFSRRFRGTVRIRPIWVTDAPASCWDARAFTGGYRLRDERITSRSSYLLRAGGSQEGVPLSAPPLSKSSIPSHRFPV
eukprot:3770622-Pyramimonas_sp.AAC.1